METIHPKKRKKDMLFLNRSPASPSSAALARTRLSLREVAYMFLFLSSYLFGIAEGGVPFLPNPVGCTGFDEVPICSGHGVCRYLNGTETDVSDLPGTYCDCYGDWTGTGDMVDMTDHECTQNKTATIVIFSLNLFLSSVVFYLAASRLIRSFLSIRHNMKKKNEPRLCRATCTHLTKLRVARLAILTVPVPSGVFIICASRLSSLDDRYLLGYNGGITFVYCVSIVFFWTANVYFGSSWMSMMVALSHVSGKTKAETRKVIQRLTRTLFFSYLIGVSSVITVVFSPIVKTEANKALLLLLHGITGACTALSVAYANTSAGRNLKVILSAGLDTLKEEQKKERAGVLANITRRNRASANSAVSTFIFWNVIIWWPWMRSKFIYFLGFLWFSTMLLLAVNLKMLAPPVREDRKKHTKQEEVEMDARMSGRLSEAPRKAVAKKPRKQNHGDPPPLEKAGGADLPASPSEQDSKGTEISKTSPSQSISITGTLVHNQLSSDDPTMTHAGESLTSHSSHFFPGARNISPSTQATDAFTIALTGTDKGHHDGDIPFVRDGSYLEFAGNPLEKPGSKAKENAKEQAKKQATLERPGTKGKDKDKDKKEKRDPVEEDIDWDDDYEEDEDDDPEEIINEISVTSVSRPQMSPARKTKVFRASVLVDGSVAVDKSTVIDVQ